MPVELVPLGRRTRNTAQWKRLRRDGEGVVPADATPCGFGGGDGRSRGGQIRLAGHRNLPETGKRRGLGVDANRCHTR